MKKKKGTYIKTRHLLVIMTFVCISMIGLTVTKTVSISPVQEAASYFIVPLQNGLNKIGSWLTQKHTAFQNTEKLASENEDLQTKVKSLEEQNTILTENQTQLSQLQQLYQVDQDYSQYEKVAARVISKDPGNWYSTFTINKGSADGIEKDMNVLTGGGLVGIVTNTGKNWATVRSIIDDSSNVSAMTLSTSDNCIISGNLALFDEGKMALNELHTDNTISEGEKIVTSNISDKYLPGILIGYIDEITDDSNHLTKTGYIIPAVDFQHITDVLVIKQLKESGGE